MKPIGEMIRAVRDWVNAKIESLDADTILRKTGDASKVTNVFSKYSSRTLPTSGEELNITLGKILKYFSDLEEVAFTGTYKSLSYKPILLRAKYYHYGQDAAYTTKILDSAADDMLVKMWLVVGIGGSESDAGYEGAIDFARAYLIVPKIEAETVYSRKGRSFILLQLGSSGDTARYTLKATAATDADNEYITLTVPKGSHAIVVLYELNCHSSYLDD